MNRWSSAETSNQSTHIREHGGSLAENSAPPAHGFPAAVANVSLRPNDQWRRR
jgi:hypothetical protein